MMRYLLVNVQKIELGKPRPNASTRPRRPCYTICKVQRDGIGKSSMLDNFICAKKRNSGIALVQNNIIYYCLPLFCAAGPISLLKAM